MENNHQTDPTNAPGGETPAHSNARRKTPSEMKPVEKLAHYGGILQAVLDAPDVLQVLADNNWKPNTAKLQRLISTAWELISDQQAGIGSKSGAQKTMDALRARANDIFVACRRIADDELEDPEHRRAVGVDVPLDRTYGGWLKQAVPFFTNALADGDIIEALEDWFPPEKLQEGLTLVQRTQAAEFARDASVRMSKLTTKERDEAIRLMTRKMRTFIRVLQSALVDRPDLAAAIGIEVRTPVRPNGAATVPLPAPPLAPEFTQRGRHTFPASPKVPW